MSLTRGFLTENLYDSPFAGFQYFLYGMRLILKRVNNFGKSYSNQFGLFYRWNHIFIMQQKDWDCGIACCAMVLKWYDLHPNLIYRHELSARGRPLWSIDLFIFLCQTRLNAIMYTTSLDVQQHHSDYDWYQTSLEEDSKLIKNQIEYTVKKQLNVINKCLTIQEIASILCDEVNVIAIILIDALTFSGKPSRTKYLGHYILLLKYDHDNDEFYFFNPAVKTGIQKISATRLDNARSHPATDHDIIFINR